MEVIDMTPTVSDIDLSNVRWTLEIDDAMRRSLIRYFRSRIIEAVLNRALEDRPKPTRIKNMEPIDALAWRMADDAIDRVTLTIDDLFETSYLGVEAHEAVNEVLPEALKETESEFLEGESLELAVTFDMAFEMPFPTIE